MIRGPSQRNLSKSNPNGPKYANIHFEGKIFDDFSWGGGDFIPKIKGGFLLVIYGQYNGSSMYIKLYSICVCVSVLAKNWQWHCIGRPIIDPLWKLIRGTIGRAIRGPKTTSKMKTTLKIKNTSKIEYGL